MHLHHPSLSLNGRKKGRVKFRNAEEARKARELDASWKELQKKWEVDADEKKRRRAMKAETLVYKLAAPAGRSTTHHIPSVNTGTSQMLCLCSRTKKQWRFPECAADNYDLCQRSTKSSKTTQQVD